VYFEDEQGNKRSPVPLSAKWYVTTTWDTCVKSDNEAWFVVVCPLELCLWSAQAVHYCLQALGSGVATLQRGSVHPCSALRPVYCPAPSLDCPVSLKDGSVPMCDACSMYEYLCGCLFGTNESASPLPFSQRRAPVTWSPLFAFEYFASLESLDAVSRTLAKLVDAELMLPFSQKRRSRSGRFTRRLGCFKCLNCYQLRSEPISGLPGHQGPPTPSD
jgi:hypothetical protein